ncbi:MAG: ABC transporter permease [Lachnospiraceae bacterium]|nr:ABC transporter permease [Lachnospiraceae bacterium]
MEQFMILTSRNSKVYFRDRGAIFFSLLSALIVIGLMVFFLGDMNIDGVVELLDTYAHNGHEENQKNAELLVLAWTCAGLLSINAVTVSLAVYSIMIKDRVNGTLNAIFTAPISRLKITLSYIASAWIAAVIMCTLTLGITEVYGILSGMEAYTWAEHMILFAMIMINSFVYAALMYPLAMLAKTEGAWSGFGTVIGTLVGFLGGIYIPIGSLADSISGLMKCTPIIYGTSMFRKVMTKSIMETTFVGAPGEVVEMYREIMGIELTVADYTLKLRDEWLILLACGIIFLVIGMCMLKYQKKTDR